MITHNYVVPEMRGYVELLTRPAKTAGFPGLTGWTEPHADDRNTARQGASGQQIALLRWRRILQAPPQVILLCGLC